MIILLTILLNLFVVGTDAQTFRAFENDDKIVASIDGRDMYLDTFRAAYVDYLNQTGQQDSDRLRLAFLESQISQEIVTHQSRGSHIPSPSSEIELEIIRRKLLIEGYLSERVYSEIKISENDLREMFVRTRTSIKASHLFAPTEAIADSLYNLLEAGADFRELARTVFSDPELAESGGSVGYFEFDEMDPAFEDAAYELEVGQYSRPVRTAQGYSIVKVDDKFVDPILTESEFATKKDRLSAYVLVRARSDARRDFFRVLADDLQIQESEDGINLLYATLLGPSPLGREADLPEFSTVILSSSNGPLTVREFIDEARHVSEDLRAQIDTRQDLIAFARGIVIRQQIVRLAGTGGIEQLPSYRQAYEEAVDDWHYERMWAKWKSEIVVSDQDAQSYLRDHPADFADVEKRDVWEILVDDPTLAKSLAERVTEDSFFEIATEYSIRPGARDAGGFLGTVSRAELGILANSVFDAEVMEIVGPLKVGSRYAIFLAGEKYPPGSVTVDDVRDEIINVIFQDKLRAKVRTEVEKMRSETDVSIDYSGLYEFSLSGSI